MYNNKEISLRKLNLKSLRGKNFEILATRGKLKSHKKDITVFSCYLPPRLSKNESNEMIETLADAIAESKTTSDGWYLVGGDWNGRSLSPLLQLYPDLSQIQTGPTRNDSVLDKMLSNFGQFVENSQTCFPIEGEVGQTSDHQMVILEARLPRSKAFRWEIHEYLRITKDDMERFKNIMDKEDWKLLNSYWPDQDKMAEEFQSKLYSTLMSCFNWKRVRRRTSDKPWI